MDRSEADAALATLCLVGIVRHHLFQEQHVANRMVEVMREIVTDPYYLELTNLVLNELKDMMNFIADREGKKLEELFPTFPAWSMKEVRLVKASLEVNEKKPAG